MAVWARPPRRRPVQMDVHVHMARWASRSRWTCVCVWPRMAPHGRACPYGPTGMAPGPDGRDGRTRSRWTCMSWAHGPDGCVPPRVARCWHLVQIETCVSVLAQWLPVQICPNRHACPWGVGGSTSRWTLWGLPVQMDMFVRMALALDPNGHAWVGGCKSRTSPP